MPPYPARVTFKLTEEAASAEDDTSGEGVRIHGMDFEQILVPPVYPRLDSFLCNLSKLTSSSLQYCLYDYH